MPITGTQRDDPLLSLDDADLPRRDRVITEALRLYREAHDIHGGTADWAAADRMGKPAVGDLVLELTRSAWSKDRHTRAIGFGYLLAVADGTWHVQYGPDPDDVCTWENCHFIAVPDAARR